MVKMNFGKMDFLWIVPLFAVFIVGVVFAYNSGVDPSVMGHSAGELHADVDGDGVFDKSLQEAIDAGDFGVGGSSDSAYGCISYDVLKDSSVDVYESVSIVLDGKNICEDDDGCSYMLIEIDTTNLLRPVDSIERSDNQIYFQSESSGNWANFGGGDHDGVNGNEVTRRIHDLDHKILLMDDQTGVETNKDEWTLEIKKDCHGDVARVIICD